MIKRPNIEWKKVFIAILKSAVIDVLLMMLFVYIVHIANVEEQVKKYVSIIKYIYLVPVNNYIVQVYLVFMLFSIIIHLKRIMIFLVRLYQLWAPEMMRKL